MTSISFKGFWKLNLWVQIFSIVFPGIIEIVALSKNGDKKY